MMTVAGWLIVTIQREPAISASKLPTPSLFFHLSGLSAMCSIDGYTNYSGLQLLGYETLLPTRIREILQTRHVSGVSSVVSWRATNCAQTIFLTNICKYSIEYHPHRLLCDLVLGWGTIVRL